VDHLTVSFFLTRRCTSRCRHCGAWHAKSADRDFTRANLARFIADVAGTPGIEAVGFSGGEVFVVKDVFDFAVDEARRLGLPFTFVTNASWAKTEALARERLSRYAGTLGMGLSADSFHEEFIPVDRVVNAAKAAEALGIPYVVRATMRASDRPDGIERRLVEAGLPDPAKIAYAPVMYIGQAAEKIDPADFPDDNPRGPCLSLRTPFIFPNGDVYACCGEAGNIEGNHPLFLGNLNETRLADLATKYETDPTLAAIYTIGPRALWDKAGREVRTARDELLLRSPCGTCRLLFEGEQKKVSLQADVTIATAPRFNGSRLLIQPIPGGGWRPPCLSRSCIDNPSRFSATVHPFRHCEEGVARRGNPFTVSRGRRLTARPSSVAGGLPRRLTAARNDAVKGNAPPIFFP
jgi:hypothetical protein